jgi:HD superfamily phosphodiesterase
MARRGVLIDATLATAAALLHDIDKMLSADHPLKPLGHAHAGATWMRESGHAELASVVEHHPVMELGHAESYEAWAMGARLEGRVVAYADKRAKQDLVSLDERFAEWHGRHPGSAPLFVAQERARLLEREICELAGVRAGDIAREGWVREAMRAAA